jgi:hypothetical protein
MKLYAVLALAILNIHCGQGPQGIPGPQGSPGNIGPQGPKGQDGTQITVIQFCTGAPQYPTNFPETGLCINDKIYAVYSANDGFLTEITPGRYVSNAVGSSCSFQVLDHCVIIR